MFSPVPSRLIVAMTLAVAAAYALPAPRAETAVTLAAAATPLPKPKPGTDEQAEGTTTEAAAQAGTPLPRPKPAGIASVSHGSRGLQPVASSALAAATKAALDGLFARRYDEAFAAQRRLDDPLAIKLVEFLYLRDRRAHAPHQRIAAFLAANPEWPSRERLRKRYEVALLSQGASAGEILAAFESSDPVTIPGQIALAGALQASGKKEQAEETVRALWRRSDLTDGEERLIRGRFGNMLSAADHRARMNILLHAEERAPALELAKELGGDDLKLAEARIAVLRGLNDASKRLDALPKKLRDHPVYQLSRIQLLRRSGKGVESARLMAEIPADPGRVPEPDVWSLERRIAARELIEAGDAKTAYAILEKHAATSDIEKLETEWLAGWVALNFLGEADAAITHFEKLRETAGLPISIARAEYWLARALDTKGEEDKAQEHFRLAAQHATTYYGQLAMTRLGTKAVAPPKKPIHAAVARRLVQETEPVRALRLLHQAGYEDLAMTLLTDLAEGTEDPLKMLGLAEIAHATGDANTTVRVGKEGVYGGDPTEAYAFTRQGLPSFTAVGPEIEPALIYAIARQESLFDHKALSHAGAMGLMQLMPGTARGMAKLYGLAYSEERLTTDPAYNATIGAAFLGDLVAEFGTSYPLVFAAYNAGPSRVYQWLKRFGDPRTGAVDPIDWVELIPFYETRNYVQRVMENLQVYRAALADRPMLHIAQDLGIPDTSMIAGAGGDNPFNALSDADGPQMPTPPTGLGFAPAPGGVGLGFSGPN